MINWGAVGLVAAAALAANLPLGAWRSRLRKFSPAWFVAVHLSIPFIIYLRYLLGVSAWFIPLTFGMAVAGQVGGGVLGARWHPPRPTCGGCPGTPSGKTGAAGPGH